MNDYNAFVSNVNKQATLTLDKLHITVTILDIKKAFGRIDVLLRPVNGSGEQWVNSDKITLIKE